MNISSISAFVGFLHDILKLFHSIVFLQVSFVLFLLLLLLYTVFVVVFMFVFVVVALFQVNALVENQIKLAVATLYLRAVRLDAHLLHAAIAAHRG